MAGKTIGIDLRGVTHGVQTGVGQYARGLLDAIWSRQSPHTYVVFDNQWKQEPLPQWVTKHHVKVVQTRLPNKAFTASTVVARRPRIDGMVERRYGTLDYFFSPNINFTQLSPATKHILTVHDLSFEHYPERYSWWKQLRHKTLRPREQCQSAEMIITPSEHTKEDLVATYGIAAHKIHVVTPGIHPSAAMDDQRLACVKQTYDLPETFILFLGTIEPRKNILSLIEAYRSLERTDVPLIIAGAPGWKNTHILSAIDDTPGVRYIGCVTEEEKWALYALATLFVYPSMYEGFGFPVLEAMAAGTPVITSHHSSLPEVAGDAAYYVSPRNVSELAHGLQCLLDDDALKKQYRQKGADRAEQFQWESAAQQWLSLI